MSLIEKLGSDMECRNAELTSLTKILMPLDVSLSFYTPATIFLGKLLAHEIWSMTQLPLP